MMDRRLAFVTAHMAVTWLYFINSYLKKANLLQKSRRKFEIK